MKTIQDFDLKNKRVIIRCDFNVPIKDGKIMDDYRIISSLTTIKYALDNGAKVILMSHLGRVKEEADLKKYTLLPVSLRLSELLNKKVIFSPKTRGPELESMISKMVPGDIILIQNTRYEDLNGQKESGNDTKLGQYWASLGDIFINDAFGTAHRSHASNVGISSNLPSGVGFLIEKELRNLKGLTHPDKPFVVILGGAKVKDKIGVIESLINKADYVLIGGGMAYTFLKSQGKEIGNSIVDTDSIQFCQKLLTRAGDKIILPIDNLVAESLTDEFPRLANIDDIKPTETGYDIGEETINLFKDYLKSSKTVFWNGPVGMSEYSDYANGTSSLLKYLASSDKTVIIGGGDTVAQTIKLGLDKEMTHVSTGGGASLEYIEGKSLPGIAIID